MHDAQPEVRKLHNRDGACRRSMLRRRVGCTSLAATASTTLHRQYPCQSPGPSTAPTGRALRLLATSAGTSISLTAGA